MLKIKINEIFYSLQGEGLFTGTPAIFIRLADCNLSCYFCDTDFSVKKEMTELKILEECKKYNCNRIIITGGEPLLQDLKELLLVLCTYDIHLETNGTIPIPESWIPFTFITVSPKTVINIQPDKIDEWKVVISERETIETIEPYVKSLRLIKEAYVFLQPCWYSNLQRNSNSINNTVQIVKELSPCRLSLQTQKLINIK